ncbi:MAG: hypothetical protein OHK0015_41920 [Chloroflexi bacterium OHK40]
MGVSLLGVENVGADDPVVTACVVPGHPVGQTVADRKSAVAGAVAPADLQRTFVPVGLHHLAAMRCGDDPGETGAGAELQHPPAAQPIGAIHQVVGEGDRCRPEGHPVRHTVAQHAEEVSLVRVGQHGVGVEDGPHAPTEPQAVLLERELASLGHQ